MLMMVSVAAAAAVVAAWPTLTKGGVLPALVTTGALGMGAWSVWLLGSASGLGRAVRWLDARMPTLRFRHSWGVLLLLSGALAFRVSGLLWPLWVLSWQPVAVGLGVVCAWWAVPTGRASLALAGAAFAAAFSTVDGLGGAWLLLCVAALPDWSRPRITAAVAAVAAVAAGAAYVAVPSLLGAEVVLTALLAWAATMLLGVLAVRGAAEELPSR
jgi:hypothetical protein